MKLVETVTTEALSVGDTVEFAGVTRTVSALLDTGRAAVFGSGNEWLITLESDVVGRKEMAVATSQKWNRV